MSTANNTGDLQASTATKHCVRLLQTGETFMCGSYETLLQGMARIGRKGIPVGCLNGGCGVCKIVIRSGNVKKTGAMSRAHISEQDEAQGVVLACRVAPDGYVELEVTGCIKKTIMRAQCGVMP
ncbi:2Fe-2S iron-sulfur cluster binding domain-containing protein [Collimonas sp. OK607]|uniref:2Fe-2S iron-sulfur cluster-binding protein n=1 Tax=Collimonas sp. OK607 TaxID=1798194 RepID=UPI0008DFA7FA|nr:2Fe-2S iron-sulfur cluster-binding protein [Collimonas sp. OK607]SFB35050.1 2Fe-2S iron-sulfur cluster binding domain-containing protein [Collimonas sp. OK607]